MRTVCRILLIICVLSTSVFAQENISGPAKATRSFIEQEGSSSKLMAIPNSVNSSILVLYIYEKGDKDNLVARMLDPRQITYSKSTLVQRSPRKQRWDAIWHPLSKRYHVVCIYRNIVITKQFKADGSMNGGTHTSKEIDERFFCAPLGKKNVLITYADKKGIVGQVMRGNGTIKGKIHRIAFNDGDNVLYPVDAMRDNRGNVAILSGEYNPDKDGIRPRVIRIDSRFNLLADKKHGNFIGGTGKPSFPGSYDSATSSLAFVLDGRLTTVNDDDKTVIKSAELPAWINGELVEIGAPAYDLVADIYLLPFVQLLGNTSPKTKLGLISMRPDGSVANDRLPLGGEVGNPNAFYFSIAQDRSRFGFVSTDADRGISSFKRRPR